MMYSTMYECETDSLCDNGLLPSCTLSAFDF